MIEEVSRAEKGRRKRLTMGRAASRVAPREVNDTEENGWSSNTDGQPEQGTAMPAAVETMVSGKDMGDQSRMRARISELETRLANVEEQNLCKVRKKVLHSHQVFGGYFVDLRVSHMLEEYMSAFLSLSRIVKALIYKIG